MAAVWRVWHRVVMVVAFVGWDVDLWRVQTSADHLVMFTVDSSPWTVYWVSRGVVTLCLLFSWVYFSRNSVVGSREESTRIITRG